MREAFFILATLHFSGCSAVGSVPRSGRGGRWFESSHPDFLSRLCYWLSLNSHTSPSTTSSNYSLFQFHGHCSQVHTT